jgi:uncharacterized protein YjbJ (UPF0337 family)
LTDQHTKGAISKARGKLDELLGSLTGNKTTKVKGQARQVQGAAQDGLGDLQDAVKAPKTQG